MAQAFFPENCICLLNIYWNISKEGKETTFSVKWQSVVWGIIWKKFIEYILVSIITREAKGKEGDILAGDVQKGTQTSDGCTERHTHILQMYREAHTSDTCMERPTDIWRMYGKSHSHPTDARRSTQTSKICTESRTHPTNIRRGTYTQTHTQKAA
jgi:hypothetical protein